MKDRDDYPELYKAPEGFYKGNKYNKKAPSFNEVFTKSDLARMHDYYKKLLENYPDVMTAKQVAEFTGYGTTSVGRWCNKQELKSIFIKQKYLIPKEYLLDFLISKFFIGIVVKSVKHKKYNQQFSNLKLIANM